MARARLEAAGSPRGLSRLVYRAPIALYRCRLGWLLGKRFLMLEHTGRKTGRTRRTVLEVVGDRPGALYVAAAWRGASDWLKNIEAKPSVVVHWGGRRFPSTARVIDRDTAQVVLGDYAAKNPGTFERLVRFMLDDPGETIEEGVALVAATIPVVELPKPAP